MDEYTEPPHYRFIHLIFIILIGVMIHISDSYKAIYTDLTSIAFMIQFFLLLIFVYWGLNHKHDNIRRATQRATSAFIIAYLAHIDMVFTAFMVVWMFVFHTGDQWV